MLLCIAMLPYTHKYTNIECQCKSGFTSTSRTFVVQKDQG